MDVHVSQSGGHAERDEPAELRLQRSTLTAPGRGGAEVQLGLFEVGVLSQILPGVLRGLAPDSTYRGMSCQFVLCFGRRCRIYICLSYSCGVFVTVECFVSFPPSHGGFREISPVHDRTFPLLLICRFFQQDSVAS